MDWLELLNSPIHQARVLVTGPATETVSIGSANSTTGQLVGGSVPAILADTSDFTYIQGNGSRPGVVGAGFTALQDANGRGIASLELIVRCTGGGSSLVGDNFGGITTSPTSDTVSLGTGAQADRTLGPFTPSAGGVWSVAEMDAMTVDIELTLTSSGTRIVRVRRTVTYADTYIWV